MTDSSSPPSGEALSAHADAVLPFVHALHDAISATVREGLMTDRGTHGSTEEHDLVVKHGDVSYPIDIRAERIVDEFFRSNWNMECTVTLVCEGIGRRTYPEGASEEIGDYLIIIDPIDGSRELMYDKRSAWILTGVAINRGSRTDLRDIFVAVQTELPTSKQTVFSALSAIKGRGSRHDLCQLNDRSLRSRSHLRPSSAERLDDGYAVFVDFFEPGPRVPTALLADDCLSRLYPDAGNVRARVFNDQYISTGGQMFLLATGVYRLVADLRPALTRQAKLGRTQSAHPYDLCTYLIAEEAGAILTDAKGTSLRYPLNVNTPCDWIGYSNSSIRALVEPVLSASLKNLHCR